MSHTCIWMSHVTHVFMNGSCHPCTWMGHVTHMYMNESCHTYVYEWAMMYVGLTHIHLCDMAHGITYVTWSVCVCVSVCVSVCVCVCVCVWHGSLNVRPTRNRESAHLMRHVTQMYVCETHILSCHICSYNAPWHIHVYKSRLCMCAWGCLCMYTWTHMNEWTIQV